MKNNMILTFQTETHDFYAEDPKVRKHFYYGGGLGDARLYNIVPTGSEVPTSGYLLPRQIMDIKGYQELTVRECFVNFFMKCRK